jgi:hypothetical protein
MTTWRYGFNLADEGFYWYGAQRTLLGEVPLRDFMSYDIGRYYWSALVMLIMGDNGIFSARLSAAIYQCIGTISGVYLCLTALGKQGVFRWIFGILSACVLTVWMFPYYKVYDHATSLVLIVAITAMVSSQKSHVWFLSGICLGLAAIMGRNHGVYGAFAAMLVIVNLMIKNRSFNPAFMLGSHFFVGVLLGFSPTIVVAFTVNGFASAFIDSIALMFAYGSTNIGLPVPWPWICNYYGLDYLTSLHKLMIGITFLMLILVPVVFFILLYTKKLIINQIRTNILYASVVLSIPYAHYVFSRPDTVHISLGIFPLLVFFVTLASTLTANRSIINLFLLLCTSCAIIGNNQPYLASNLLNKSFAEILINDNIIYTSIGQDTNIKQLQSIINSFRNKQLNFLALPNMPSIHAIYNQKMPIWEIYSLIPRKSDFEKREIDRLITHMPYLILLSNHALDGNLNLTYSKMHPLTYEFINSKYNLLQIDINAINSDFSIFTVKD